MNFYIKQNSILPNLKMKLYMDGRLDYKKFHDLLENATVTFSMKNINNGTFKIINKESQIVEVQNGDNTEYYLQYTWNQNDTLESGQFEGQFRVDFLDDCSYIIVPVREKLYINILSSFTKAEIQENNNIIESEGCLIYCESGSNFTGGTVSGSTTFLTDVNICEGDLYVHNIIGCSPITINNNLVVDEGFISGNTVYFDTIYSGNTELSELLINTFTTGVTLSGNTAIFNRNDGNSYNLDLSTIDGSKYWLENKNKIINNDETIVIKGDYVLSASTLTLETSNTLLTFSGIDFYKRAKIFIDGYLLLIDSNIINNGEITVGNAIIFIGNSTITGTGILN